jgi:16S rRNA (uracil1498-N3)-methyltransferase
VHARFYAPDARASGDLVALPDDEAQHLTRVLRLKAGDAVRVFNGHGSEFTAAIEEAANTGVRVRVGARCTAAPEARVAVTLAQAVLKGDKMDDVVRDAVMIGVAAIQPILTARSEVTRATIERGHRLERWHRIAIASAKQCGRAVIPHVHEPLAIEALADAVSTMKRPSPAYMFVEPAASAGTMSLTDVDETPPNEATVIVGPEGGWTPQEIEAASDRCHLLTLGPRTIRADVMSLVGLAALFARWKEF